MSIEFLKTSHAVGIDLFIKNSFKKNILERNFVLQKIFGL